MKRLMIPFSCIFIILILWVFALSFTTHTSNTIKTIIDDEIIDCIYLNKWQDAEECYYKLYAEWLDARSIYTLYMAGASLTDIDISIVRSKGYLDSRNVSLAVGELKSISEHINLLLDSQSLSVDNVF